MKTPSTSKHWSGSIPKQHELLDEEKAAEFSVWLDDELAALEAEFECFVTVGSLCQEIKQGRQ